MRTDKCSKCEKPKQLESQRYCLKCKNAYMREWRKSHPLNDEQRLKSNCRRYTNIYRERGLLKDKPCLVCGSEKVEAHHIDYKQPLNVRWLCHKDHLELHKFANELT